MPNSSQHRIRLGDEYDDELRVALRQALSSLGALGVSLDWGVAGSQELERFEVRVAGNKPLIEAESYIGLSVSGDADLVNLVQAIVRERVAQNSLAKR
jgi:hypothetical protein